MQVASPDALWQYGRGGLRLARDVCQGTGWLFEINVLTQMVHAQSMMRMRRCERVERTRHLHCQQKNTSDGADSKPCPTAPLPDDEEERGTI